MGQQSKKKDLNRKKRRYSKREKLAAPPEQLSTADLSALRLQLQYYSNDLWMLCRCVRLMPKMVAFIGLFAKRSSRPSAPKIFQSSESCMKRDALRKSGYFGRFACMCGRDIGFASVRTICPSSIQSTSIC